MIDLTLVIALSSLPFNMVDNPEYKTTISPCKHPSPLWYMSQALACCNSRRLTIPDVDCSDKWVLISGGNSGIGREAALRFAKWGANLVIGCRKNSPSREPHPDAVEEECKTAAKNAGHTSIIEWWEVDMASLESVRASGQKWLETGRSLDILCNNAGKCTNLQ